MISLALDPEVVASAWEQQQMGCGSIFSPQISYADFTVPNVISLDLLDFEAGMQQLPQQQLPQPNDCSSGAAAVTAAMICPELLLQWDAVLPVPLLPAAGQTWAPSLPGSTCTAAHKLHCVPDTPVRSLSSSTSSSVKVCGPRPAAVLPPSKRAKPQQEQQQSVSAQLAEDAQCAVVPDARAVAGAAVPSSSCCSSDSSSGPAADGHDSDAPDAPAAASASSAQVPQMPDPAVFVKVDAGGVPAAVVFAMQHPPASAQPASGTPSSSAAGSEVTAAAFSAAAAKPSWPARSGIQQHRKTHPHAAKAAAHHGSRARTAHAAATAAAAAEPFLRTRAEALARYREKRARRTHAKKIRYHLRKVNADNRPRIKGRFVKKGELAEIEADPAAAAAAVAGYNGSMWDEAGAAAAAGDAAAVAGGVMGCWGQHDDFLQAMQLPGMAAVDGNDAAAAAAAPVPAQAASSAAAAFVGAANMQLFGSAALPDSGASADGIAAAGCLPGTAASADAEAAAAAAMDMHLLGHLELGFGGLEDDAAAPMLGEDFFNDVHDMTESSGASHACLLMS